MLLSDFLQMPSASMISLSFYPSIADSIPIEQWLAGKSRDHANTDTDEGQADKLLREMVDLFKDDRESLEG